MAFVPLDHDEGKTVELPAKASIAFVKYNALKDDGSGYITNAASGDNTDVHYVCLQTKTTGTTDGAERILAIETKGVRFKADTSNTPTQTEVGTFVDLSAASTLDTSSTTDELFFVEKIFGAAADKKVIGFFGRSTPNS